MIRYIFIFVLFFNILFANVYIGQGVGKSEQEAKQNALVDISSQISTKIDSSLTTTKTRDKSDIKIKSHQKTKANLSDYKLLDIKYKDGNYFVKIEYENIPSLDRFVKKINKKYSKKQIVKAIKKDFGKSLGLELVRKDKRWYLKYKNSMQILDKKDFSRFFLSSENKNIKIKTNKRNNILYENDEFYFKVKSLKDGYVSILTVYEDGTVSILMKNIKVKAKKSENIPDKDFEAIPIAGLIEKGVETFDMYVAIYSPKKLIFDSFALADEELISAQKYKNFDELLIFLDDKTYSTLKVVTKPR
ncbi:MAG: hypothetical protein CSA86_02200 [Arcobacter sp.]|nr:MAG: hypothetical protein CSA86_02200 [Arcobacter sp.]